MSSNSREETDEVIDDCEPKEPNVSFDGSDGSNDRHVEEGGEEKNNADASPSDADIEEEETTTPNEDDDDDDDDSEPEPDVDMSFEDGPGEESKAEQQSNEEAQDEDEESPKDNTDDDIVVEGESAKADHIAEKIDELKIDTSIHNSEERDCVTNKGSDDTTPPSSGAAKTVNWTNDTKEAAATVPTPKSKKSPMSMSQKKKSALKDPSLIVTDPADRTIEMRNPYPQPTLAPPSRSPEEIIAEHTLPTPKIDPPNIVPNDQLLALIDASQSPSLARRANAIGALRVLASSSADGKTMPIKLVRTIVVLDALTNAANHTPILDKSRGIGRDEYNTALDARTRSVSLMLLLCQPKENRLRVCYHPGLLDALVKVMEEDTSEARMLASAVVATCAKTKENRQMMAKTPRLITVLSKLLKGEFNYPKDDQGGSDAKADDKIVAGEGGVERLLSMDYEEMEELKGKCKESGKHRRRADTEDDYDDEDDGDSASSSSHSGLSSNSDYGTFDESEEDLSSDDEGRGPRDAGRPLKNVIASDNNGSGNGLREQNLGKYEEFLAKSRMSACAALLHLSKHCPVSPILCEHEIFVENTLVVGEKFNDPIHTRCLELICMVTRFPGNNAALARRDGVIDTLLRCAKSKIDEDRNWSLLSLQNLTSEASNKIPMSEASILKQLRVSSLRYDNMKEQIAALSAFVNISTEPGSVVPLSSSPNVVATLITLAHSSESSKEVCDLACGCLTNMGLWLQNLASTGTVPEGMPNVPLPTHTSSGWRRWENAE